jgi:hypothetical protein
MSPDAALWENQTRIRRTINRPENDPQRRLYVAHDRAVYALGFGLHPATEYADAMKRGATS